MQGSFGVPVVMSYGNSQSGSGGSLPLIDNVVAINVPRSTIRPPSLTTAPRMPLVEKITPRRVNSSKLAKTTIARAHVRAGTAVRRGWQIGIGYGRAAKMRGQRFFQDIGTPLISK